ncbi:hypothetical protein EV361DRAFT_1009151 [Lentinula raphanica]|nr:hypothetical protein EV361DRAFT_1009151 [Lentinula raphanica]
MATKSYQPYSFANVNEKSRTNSRDVDNLDGWPQRLREIERSANPFVLLEAEEDDEGEFESDDEPGVFEEDKKGGEPANQHLGHSTYHERLDDIVSRYESSFSSIQQSVPAFAASSSSHSESNPSYSTPDRGSSSTSDVAKQTMMQSIAALDHGNLLGLQPDDPIDDEVDPLLLSFMEELMQKASEYSLLDVYAVRCQRSSESAIVSRIREDIAHERVSPDVLWNAFRSQFPGRVYLHVHNMNRYNSYLSAYLRRVPGFLYPNRQPISHRTSEKQERTVVRPDGTSVTAFLSSIPPLWDSVHLSMPIHTLIPWHDTPLALNHNILRLRYQAGSDMVQAGCWVRINAKSRLYSGDVGVVYKMEFPEGATDPNRFFCWVLLVPRLLIPRKLGEKHKHLPRPPLTLFSLRLADELVKIHGVDPYYRWCLIEDCESPLTCTHGILSHRCTFLKQVFIGSLAAVKIPWSCLTLSDVLPANLDSLFRQSGHPVLEFTHVRLQMPPSSDWIFFAGESVILVNPHSGQSDSEILFEYGFTPGTQAVIHSVEDRHCEVQCSRSQNEQLVSETLRIPKPYICKLYQVGDMVEIVARGNVVQQTKSWERLPAYGLVGSVTELDTTTGVARVVIGQYDADVDIHVNSLRRLLSGSSSGWNVAALAPAGPSSAAHITEMHRLSLSFGDSSVPQKLYTGPKTGHLHPWLNLEIVVIGAHRSKGYHGWVKNIKEDRTTKSGLAIYVQYATINAAIPEEWVDYDLIRRLETYKFLHDRSPWYEVPSENPPTSQPWIPYYTFSDSYVPIYDPQEIVAFWLPGRKQPLAVVREMNRAHEIAEDERISRLQLVIEEEQWSSRAGGTPVPSRQTTPTPQEDPSHSLQYDGPWILNPNLENGLGDREMSLKIRQYGSDSMKEHRVRLRNRQIYYRDVGQGGSKTAREQLLNDFLLVPRLEDDKSKLVPPKPGKCNLLFVLIYPPELSGQMGRRIGQVYNKENPGASKWIIQLVHTSRRKGRAERYDQEVLLERAPVTVDRAWLVPVWEAEEDRRAGNNATIEKRRREYDH